MSDWIKGAIKHPGALHRATNTPPGQKIPEAKIVAAEKQGGRVAREARFAQELKGFQHKEEGPKGR